MARLSKYTPEFRRRAVEEVLDRERTVTEVARSLSVTTPEALRRWVVQARIDRELVVGPTTEELATLLLSSGCRCPESPAVQFGEPSRSSRTSTCGIPAPWGDAPFVRMHVRGHPAPCRVRLEPSL